MYIECPKGSIPMEEIVEVNCCGGVVRCSECGKEVIFAKNAPMPVCWCKYEA